MFDKRKNPRLEVSLGGRILFNNGWSCFDCAIHDLSATGARLSVPANLKLPERFELHVISEDLIVPAETRWRRGGEIGIEFSGAGRSASE